MLIISLDIFCSSDFSETQAYASAVIFILTIARFTRPNGTVLFEDMKEIKRNRLAQKSEREKSFFYITVSSLHLFFFSQ